MKMVAVGIHEAGDTGEYGHASQPFQPCCHLLAPLAMCEVVDGAASQVDDEQREAEHESPMQIDPEHHKCREPRKTRVCPIVDGGETGIQQLKPDHGHKPAHNMWACKKMNRRCPQ
jgi:hypothetical protein